MNGPTIYKPKAFGVKPDVAPGEEAFMYPITGSQNQLLDKILSRRQLTREARVRMLRTILEEWGIRRDDLDRDVRLSKGEAMLILSVLLDQSAAKAAEQRMRERFYGQGRLV